MWLTKEYGHKKHYISNKLYKFRDVKGGLKYTMPLLTVEEAIRDIRAGKMIILVDDEDRENEGDLCMASEKVTPEAINFMATYGRGLICLSMTAEKIDSLDLPPMVDNNQSPLGTGFTVSIEARCGVSTGISAADRATTILTAVAENAGKTRTCISFEGQTGRGYCAGRTN
jgi:3,4-dihydroxy-2-butanone 4-phosphate synthase